MKTIKLLSVLLILIAGQAGAQDIAKMPPSIRTSGEAVVTAAPDQARLDIGVITQSDTSQAAAAQNAAKLESVIAALKKQLGADADLKTISYSLAPIYKYPKEGGEPTLVGYTATNTLRVTLTDLTQVGKAIDAATQSGANRIQSLNFMLKNSQAVEAQALREAAANARAKADALAAALNVQIVRILSVAESGPTVIPYRTIAFARAESASTPIEPGTIEVRANVEMTVEIRQ